MTQKRRIDPVKQDTELAPHDHPNQCPEIEALIQQRLHSGAFKIVEDVLSDALEIEREREA